MPTGRSHPELAGRTVLVTGATGFIGTHVARLCERAAARVVGVSRSTRRLSNGIRWIEADFAETGAAERVLRDVRPDYIFHLAGDSRAARDPAMVGPTLRANFVAPIHLLSAMAANPGCRRLVLIGSCEEPREKEPTSLVVPSSPYAASKFAQTTYASMFHALYGTPVTVARVCMVYGPEQQDARKFVPSVTLGLLRGESPKISSGVRRVDWIFAEDVAEGLIRLATTDGDVNGKAFDVGSGSLESIRSVAERIASFVPDAEGRLLVGALPDRPLEQEYAADARTTESVTGWRPRLALEEGLRRTVDWYRQHRAAFA